MRNDKLIPFEIVEKAVAGEPEAVNAVLQHYTARIKYLSNYHGQFNTDIQDRLQLKLIEAIEYFSSHVFKDSKSIYEYLQRHEKLIRWHIMRIYRNRNMIVHSGAYMPYRDMIVENLHFYVDVLLDTLIEYYHIGLLNHASIYKNIYIEEIEYHVSLGIPLNGNGKQTVVAISEDNALKLIFNGYSGNAVKKIINRMIEDNRKKTLAVPSNVRNTDEFEEGKNPLT